MNESKNNHETANGTKPVLNAVAVKLSKAQKEVISTLQANEIIHYLSGINARCFYSNNTMKNISWATIYKLEDLKLVERKNGKVELTEQGRSYCI